MPDGYRLTDEDRLTSAERRKRDAAQTPIVLYGTPSAEELAAARGRAGSRGVLVVPEEMRNEGLLVGVFDQEEHTHYTDRASRLCAEGDHDSAELWDRDAERVKIREAEEKSAEFEDALATMAEEPIEDRLARAYKNGLEQGLALGHRAFGRWDHS